jgi:uncharacterized protein YegJ (DUF2314 family)
MVIAYMTIPFSSDDSEMEAAIAQAKTTIKQFFDAYLSPTSCQTSFLLKVVFDEGDEVEHIWLADLDFSGDLPSGVVANDPNLPSLRFMQRVDFEPSYISDWMYVDDGRLVGGYTTRLIRDRMTSKERQELDASSPYGF